MKQYIENKISLRIQSSFQRLLGRLGFSISIQNVRLISLRKFLLNDVIITDRKDNAIVRIENVLCQLSLWQSIMRRGLAGELTVSRFVTNWRFITEHLFKIEQVIISFVIGCKKSVVLLEMIGASCLSNILRKGEDIILTSELNINWNSYISIMGENLKFSCLKNFSSENSVRFNTVLTYNKNREQSVYFDASIKADDFTLTSDDNNTIDKHLLFNVLFSKHDGNYFTDSTFIPFRSIPEYFINAIVCTEDPNFWTHNGVDLYFMGYSISANLKSERFERGASTITMQLVRNLFLNHDKNIVRKIEEGVITLLLENYFEIKKEDILELYLNLIEFAPNVYGLYNASLFYFNKSYNELSLTEILVLTYIVPRPKHFYEALLIKSEQLRNNLHIHIQQFAEIMLFKGLINYNDYISVSSTIKFSSQLGILNMPDYERINIDTQDISI